MESDVTEKYTPWGPNTWLPEPVGHGNPATWRELKTHARRAYAAMVCDEAVDMLWRIEKGAFGVYELMYLGHLPIDSPGLLRYPTYDTLPEWVKDRLAVLSMLKPDVHESVVYGVGRRVAEDVYWIVEPRNLNGRNP
jgi:hypothetical protein